MLETRQSWYRPAVAVGGASLGLFGIAAAVTSPRPDLASFAATAILPPVIGAAMIGGAWRWPRLFIPATALINVEAVLGGWLFVNGTALAILLPFIGLGLLQSVRNPRAVRLVYVAAGLATGTGATLAIFAGPTRNLPAVYPPAIALGIFATVFALALAFNWRLSGRLIEAIAETKRELEGRKATAEELRQTTGLLTSILDSSPITTIAFRSDRKVTVWNRAAERVFGWTADELIDRPLPIEMTPLDDREASADRITRTFAGEVIRGDLVRRMTKDGQERWAEIYAAPLPGPDGKPIGIAGQFVDVTERIAVDAELRRTRETLEALVAAAPLAIVLTDRDGVIQVWNREAERIYGSRAEEAIGRQVSDVTGMGDSQYAEFRQRITAGESIAGLPIERLRPDGRQLELRLFLAPVRDDAGGVTGAVSVIEDLSDRRAVEAQLRQSQKMETLGQLAGSVAHDFNNLLTAIRGFAEMAAASLGPDHDVGPDLAEIRAAADRAADLTTRLLAFSRQTPADSSVVGLNAIVEGMGPMLRRLVGPTVDLRIALDPDAGRVRIDRPQLEQAVLNLVVNARDAMPGDGVITIATRHERAGGGANDDDRRVAVLIVSDTGVGMTPDVVERAFEPFFTTKKSSEGTGLGLAIVFGAVRNANGEISIESEPGSGSTFRVVLPSVLSPDEAVSAAAPSPPSGGTESILLVEDEAAIRSFASRILIRHGYDVVSAVDAEAAIAVHAARPGRFGLLLSDVTMPGRLGPALMAELRASDPNLRVLFMSGFVPGGRGPTLPADASFLQKPFSVDELLRAVRSALDQEPEQREPATVGRS